MSFYSGFVNVSMEGADPTVSGKLFHSMGPTTENAVTSAFQLCMERKAVIGQSISGDKWNREWLVPKYNLVLVPAVL